MISTVQSYILVGLLAIISILGWSTFYYHSEYIDATVEIALAKSSIDSLTTSVNICDTNTKALSTLAKKREQEAQEALELAKKRSVVYERKAQDILVRTPKTTDLCTEASELIDSYISDLGVQK